VIGIPEVRPPSDANAAATTGAAVTISSSSPRTNTNNGHGMVPNVPLVQTSSGHRTMVWGFGLMRMPANQPPALYVFSSYPLSISTLVGHY
jgi:hypothetical protein